MAKLLMKANEALVQPSVTIPQRQVTPEDSPTKVSIPLSPSNLKMLKFEPAPEKSVIQYILPKQTDNHVFVEPNPVEVEAESTLITVPIEDSSFIDNVEDVTVNMRFLNSIPNMKKQCKGIAEAVSQHRITGKVLVRMNAILDFIKSHVVIDSVNLLCQMRQAESDLPEMICRKSLLTLCGKLAADNLLKVIEMELKSESKTVKLIFFGEPHVTFDMKCWHSIIEEQKIQHFIAMRSNEEPVADLSMLRPTISSLSFTSKTSVASEEFGPQSMRYENFPKFMKMKLFHEFLYYLIYGFPEEYRKIPIRKAMETWCRDNPKILEYDEISEKITNCYGTEISWKMFVSPLNKQRDFSDGWGLLRDIIHRIPLILFVKFTRFGQESAELTDFLAHPIKCNYLLHFLPASLREILMGGRKYIFVLQDLCKKLCWCGLLQFGPARTKEIDTTFIYLNQNATLFDTSSSEPGYLEVSDKDYPEIKFNFDSSEKVTDYWNKMFEIAINTKINKKSTAIGTTVEIEQLGSKAALLNALKVQSPMSAPLNDTGFLPGDRKGAAGLDKAFLTHLKRSWTRPLGEGDKKSQPRVRTVSKATLQKRRAKKEKVKLKSKFKARSVIRGVNEKSKIIRKVVHASRVRKKKVSLAEDVVDLEALRRMKTMRVTWSEVEDRTLLLTKVALKFVFVQDAQSSHYVNQSVVRDILHWRTEKSLNKTSKACARRLQNLMKMQPIKEQIALYLEQLRSNREFKTKYADLIDRIRKIFPLEDVYTAVKIHLVEMVHRMHQIFYKQYEEGDSSTCVETIYNLPCDYEKLTEKFTITNPANSLIDMKYTEPKTSDEAEVSTLVSLIHSVVCCSQDKTSYAFYNFEVLKKFADAQVNSAVSQLRRANVITHNKKDRSQRAIMPNSLTSYHLTIRYGAQMMSIHVPVELYDEYTQGIKALSDCEGAHQMTSLNCGWIFMLAEMISSRKIQLSYDLADKLVMVDPALRKKSHFDNISDNYLKLINKNKQEAVKKTVKLQTGEGSDETFLYSDDPIEIFFKINSGYLHAFCILRALAKGDNVPWEDVECPVEDCILLNDDSFDDDIRKISCKCRELVKEILKNPAGAASSSKRVCKENFVGFFDAFMKTYNEEMNRKDFCGKSMKRWKKLTTMTVLELILQLSTEAGLEEDTWLTEYKKICRSSDDFRLDDDEIDTSVDHIKHAKMFNQLKELNLNARTSDSFVVNLSTIYVNVNKGPVEKVTFEGTEYSSLLLPFTEEDRACFIEKIINDAKWKPEDLSVRDLFEELSVAGIKNTLEIMQLSELCTFLQSKTQIGATGDELLEIFGDKHRMHRQMETLCNMKFVLRAGVNELRFIHKDFVAFWLIDTFYTVREEVEVTEPAEKKQKLEEPSKKKSPLVRHPIRIFPSPWIRINGTLNRRVIDKWLGTLLNQLTLNPSMMLNDLCCKFNVLKPFEIRSLCEILQMIGSVQLITVNEPEISLFSNYIGGSTTGKFNTNNQN